MVLELKDIRTLIPEWGNRNHIDTVRHYNDLRLGLKPLTSSKSWESDLDADEHSIYRHAHACIICPECLRRHTVITDNDTGEFLNDSNYCTYCQTEFIFHDDSEFELYVNPEQ